MQDDVRENQHRVYAEWQLAEGITGLRLLPLLYSAVKTASTFTASNVDDAYVTVFVDTAHRRIGGGYLATIEVRGTSPEHAADVLEQVRGALPDVTQHAPWPEPQRPRHRRWSLACLSRS
jgi:hypothetical protein